MDNEIRKISWAICDDDEYTIYGYKKFLSKYDELDFLFSATNTVQCIGYLNENKPDVLLLDVQIETERAGIDIIPQILKISPETRIIMLTSYQDQDYIFSAFSNGAIDYCLKENDVSILYKMIVDVYNNQSMLRPEIAKIITKGITDMKKNQSSLLYLIEIMTKLSNAEYEILMELHAGKKYAEIAEMRFVEVSTIKVHASRILKKFNHTTMKELLKSLEETKVFSLFNKN